MKAKYNIDEMSAQEVFDASFNHVINQGYKSELNYCCVYKNRKTGHQCAAGIFLNDIQCYYGDGTSTAEDNINLSWNQLVLRGLVSKKHIGLINELQNCHDFANGVNFISDFINRMRFLAKDFNLEFKV